MHIERLLSKTFPKLFPIAANPFLQYLAPLGAKYIKKDKKSKINVEKIRGNVFFAFFWVDSEPGEAVNKSAASAASPHGFSSRDQVGC